ncbi:MAG TPA: kelch repeat-containing protein, partial [Candidatus Dormibacteraeota bacterium]|nr:kelch repeat-containing protein [Candidatus Dormibacteraeota bacterium]
MRPWPTARACFQIAAVGISSIASLAYVSPANVLAAAGQPNWSPQSPAASPVGRSYAGMAYDSARSRTVLFGGGNNTNSTHELNDTWEWDGSHWTQFFPLPAPPVSIGPGMAYDSKRGVTVLLDNNSNTWEWNGQSWTQKVTSSAPPARVWTSMVFDSTRGVMVLFGGIASGVQFGDTWTYDGTNWAQQAPASSPPARYLTSLAFDSVRGVVVMFGGWNGQRLNDTWEWNGSNWTQRTPGTSPFPRFSASMVYDATVGATVMFGGDHIEPFLLGPSNDTWLWNGSNWTQDFTFAAPSARAGQSMAYQSALGTDVLFGGSDELNPGTFPSDTWELGSGFVTPPGNPAATLNANILAFKVNAIGTTSASARLVVSSSGTGPLLISSIAASGDFAVASTTCPLAPTPVAAGTFCIVQVTFTSSLCATETGSLTLSDNGLGGSQSVQLEGGVLSSTCDG